MAGPAFGLTLKDAFTGIIGKFCESEQVNNYDDLFPTQLNDEKRDMSRPEF